jgi:hypothetical protein
MRKMYHYDVYPFLQCSINVQLEQLNTQNLKTKAMLSSWNPPTVLLLTKYCSSKVISLVYLV